MKKQEKLNGLQTLAELHADRIEGYHKVASETQAADYGLEKLFNHLAEFSKEAKAELDLVLASRGGEISDNDNSILSGIHKMWIDIKTALTSKDREALLSSCEFGENIIIGAYESMLENEDLIEVKVRLLLHSHLKTLKESLKTIQELKELEEIAE
ncbi:PA2169 family four-helix-bundle protein [Jiulongibacter sp. NS-SX5]|uniref:PA2169 family four-helix-bundle protein n=1 Tax=Jiulongibacter sp. NS-SX5 TaxID=3463854 RepID=UPI00405A3AF8